MRQKPGFGLECLEPRICPSSLNLGAVLVTPNDPLTFGGEKLIEVDAGKALVYVTDVNNDGLDSDDIVGISVSEGIRLTSHVDIHGDIVTNLTKNGVLSGDLQDGSVLEVGANISQLIIEGSVDGSILAGGAIGAHAKGVVTNNVVTSAISPIHIDGSVQVIAAGSAAGDRMIFTDVNVTVGGFHIGPTTLAPFEPTKSGPSIGGLQIGAASTLTLIQAGDAGIGGKAGDIFDVQLAGSGQPYSIIAGDGASADKAGDGGSISNITQTGGSVSGAILFRAGSGGDNHGKNGGTGGSIRDLDLSGSGDYSILGGAGGDGGNLAAGNPDDTANGSGGDGGSLVNILLASGGAYNLSAGDGGSGGKNGGNGGFITNSNNGGNVAATAPPTFILSADFNKDASLDLLTLNASEDNFTIFLNDGQGDFKAAGTFTVDDNPQRAFVIDIDGDGNLDVFVSNLGSNNVSVLFGNGDGTFDPAVNLAVGNGPVGIAVGQVNFISDNLLDLIVANSLDDTITILFGTGGGRFNTLSPTILNVGEPVFALTTGDLDATSDLDIAVTSPNPDLVGNDNVALLLGNGPTFQGDGTFQPPQNFRVGELPVDIANANLNGGFILDLAVVNQGSDTVSVLFGHGGFPIVTYDPAVNLPVGHLPSSVVIVDLTTDPNPDLNADLVVTNSADNTVSVLLNNGDSTFAEQAVIAVGNNPVSVATGDFDHDGNQDVAVANQGASNLSILFGNGDGTFKLAGEQTGGVIIHAGNGGDGTGGTGGDGGFIGQNPDRKPPTIEIPNISIAAQGAGGAIDIRSGSGGDGAKAGGDGAGIARAELKASNEVVLTTGDGGDSDNGRGGDAGSVGHGAGNFDVVVDSGGGEPTTITTGAGGDGRTGGGQAGKIANSHFDTSNELVVTTGNGGTAAGSGEGGAGGTIDASELSGGISLTIVTGDGGTGLGKAGANGGSLTNTHLLLATSSEEDNDLLITLGNGAAGIAGGGGGSFRNSILDVAAGTSELTVNIHTGSGGDGAGVGTGKSSGGAGGEFSAIHLNGLGGVVNLTVDPGKGGDSDGGKGGDGGSVKSLLVDGVTGDIAINNSETGNNGAGGTGLSGGAGGKVDTIELATGTLGGTLLINGGTGGAAQSGTAGAGGSVSGIKGEFLGVFDHQGGSESRGVRLLGGQGGAASSGAGGAGGDVGGAEVSSGATDITFLAGGGGDGTTAGGAGGSLSGLKANSGQSLLFQAGDGGGATGLNAIGGAGGSVSSISQAANPAQQIRQIVAGNGGAAGETGGIGGKGGSIDGVNTMGDIGDFSRPYGIDSMGGLFAGAGGLGSGSDGANGSVTHVTAGRIAAIVAGTDPGPVAAALVDDITANVIAANIDANDPGEFIFPAFDFHDANGDSQFTLGADPDHDPAEVPIDGLIFADVIGRINLPPGVTPLYVVEVNNPPPIGNVDPQP